VGHYHQNGTNKIPLCCCPKKFAKAKLRNTKVDTTGARVNWMSMCWIRFVKESPDSILFKCEHDDMFREMKVSAGSRRGRQQTASEILPVKVLGETTNISCQKEGFTDIT
jgi:hypothetical protein